MKEFESTFTRLMSDPEFAKRFEAEYSELVTSDIIPKTHGSVEPLSQKKKKDKLYLKRLKQNPSLKNNIQKIGEQQMITTVTYTSDNSSAISRQWHLMFTIDDKSWNSWKISDVKANNGKFMFTLASNGDDQRVNEKDLQSSLIAGVKMSISTTRNESLDQENAITAALETAIDLGMDIDQMVDLLLAEEPEIQEEETILSPEPEVQITPVEVQEKEEDDSKDGESDTIDDVQTMLTKMLPKTKDLKLGADKEKELKAHLSKAMSLMGEESQEDSPSKKTQEDASYPQFQFSVLVPRDEYEQAAKILDDSSIVVKTKYSLGDLALLGFDNHMGTGHGKPEVSEEDIIAILQSSGISAVSGEGMDDTSRLEPVTLDIQEESLEVSEAVTMSRVELVQRMAKKMAKAVGISEADALTFLAMNRNKDLVDKMVAAAKKKGATITEASGARQITESSPMHAKEADKVIKQVMKATGWKNGKDVSDSASDLVRMDFPNTLNQIDSSDMKKLAAIGVRLSRTKTGWQVSKPL